MSSQLIVCIVIFILTLISFILNKIPMWVTAISSMLLLVITGCLNPATALGGFSNSNTILMAAMFMVAAGLTRTTFIDSLCKWIMKITKGSFTKAYFGYIVITVLLANFISSPVVVFSIVAPLVSALCKENNISPSKIIYPICIVAIGCSLIFPTDGVITQVSQNNGFLEIYGMDQYVIEPIDFFIAKWPMLIVIPLWALFIGPKFMPDEPTLPINIDSVRNNGKKKELSKFSNNAGILIFFITILALLFSQKLGFQTWWIASVAGIFMVLFGTLTSKEALSSLPLDIILLFVGALGLGGALSETGAGDIIGQWLSIAVGGTQNNYVIGALFFIVPFIMTQFMLNRGVVQVFTPICILACQALGANPIGPMILVTAGCMAAFLTPMATPAVPLAMAQGGYNLKDLLKGSWLITIVIMFVYVFYVMTVLPAF